jgi:hypothetical protein
MNQITIGKDEFLGNPVLSLKNGEADKHPCMIGVAMARRILQALRQEPGFLERFCRESGCTA